MSGDLTYIGEAARETFNEMKAERDAAIQRAEKAEAQVRLATGCGVVTGVVEVDSAETQALRERECAALAQVKALMGWVDKYEADTRALPAQAEDKSKGQSSFNWRMSFVRELRAALAATAPKEGTT